MPVTANAPREAKPTRVARPFVHWVGGKREMMNQYKLLLPASYNRYYEPFLGGGAMFFELTPKVAILADSNPELIEAYRALRADVDAVIALLYQLKERHSKELFLAVRQLDRDHDLLSELPQAEIAARFIYLNQTCFNGLYRVNQKGQFNTPLGSSLNRVICDEPGLRLAAAVLAGTDLRLTDFADLAGEPQAGDFVYLDPPYLPVSEYSDFDRYTKEKFRLDDHERLRDLVDTLAARGCLVLISNSDTPLTRELYADYHLHSVQSTRTLNSRAERRGAVGELAITTYEPPVTPATQALRETGK